MSSSEHRRDSELPMNDSLRFVGSLSIVGGPAAIIALMGFLSFLQFEYGSKPGAADASWV